jgi:serine/threonine-protein kinase
MAAAGRYKAIRKIADGGTAEVFLAEQVGAAGFRRLVVLKRIREALYADVEFRRLLVEEAHIAMGLHHSNLVEVLDLGDSRGRYFLVLELVDGWTLQQLLERAAAAKVPVPPQLALYACAEVCRALAYAHNRTRGGVPLNIVHRDVCPNNVLVSETGEVKLTDFGIAKARTRTRQSEVGTAAGKPSYMSPEQASGEALDARSDLFSVGTLLYYLLTAQLPFRAPNDRELMIRVASGEFVSPAKVNASLPKGVVKLVLKAMQRLVSARFQSAQEMLTAVEKVQREELAPFGRSELEAWLRALTKADGRVPVTRESMVPQPAQKEEWIELSSQELVAIEDEPAPKKKGAGWLLPMGAAAVLVAAAAALLYPRLTAKNEPPTLAPIVEAPQKDAGLAAVALAPPPAATVEQTDAALEALAGQSADAGVAEENAEADAGALAAVAPEPPAPPAPEPVAPTAPPLVPAPDAPHPAEPPPAPKPAPPAADRDFPAAPTTVLPPLKVRAYLAPPQKDPVPKDRAAVQFETEPQGANVVVDHHTLGTTPVALRFKLGVTFEVTFEHEGFTPVVQWLTLVERPDRPPRVQLHPPPPH